MRMIIFVLALLSASHAEAFEVVPCRSDMSTLYKIRDYYDAHTLTIFKEVLEMADLGSRQFSLCESDYFVPAIVPVYGPRNNYFVMLPSYVRTFSDDELRGLFAHEFAHVPMSSYIKTDEFMESQVDLHGAK